MAAPAEAEPETREARAVRMRAAIVTPHYTPLTRGNAVTVQRVEQELRDAGCHIAVYALDTVQPEPLWDMEDFRPHLIHAFHGYLGGCVARHAAERLNIPYIVTLTGTDVYESLTDTRSREISAALADAALLTVFHDSVRLQLAGHFPALAEKTVIIPQGVAVPAAEGSQRFETPFPAGAFTFFLPAGLRRVKNVLAPLAPLARLYRKHPQIRFLLAGPVLELDYANEVLQRLKEYPFARYVGTIDHDAIGSVYRSCDVVLNCSDFEGGMANSVLEALAWGKPVLASAAEGNRSVIENGATGLTYTNEDNFYRQALRLIEEIELGKRLGENGRRLVREKYSPRKEGAAYLDLYRQVLSGRSS